MLCPYRTKTTSHIEIITINNSPPYPSAATVTETEFQDCYERDCMLYDKAQQACKLGKNNYGTSI